VIAAVFAKEANRLGQRRGVFALNDANAAQPPMNQKAMSRIE